MKMRPLFGGRFQLKRLPSRNYESSDAFVQDFLETLKPGIIPRLSFMPWTSIDKKLIEFIPAIDQFEAVSQSNTPSGIESATLENLLLASADPTLLVRCAFILLGHSGNSFVSAEDNIVITEVSAAIARGDRLTTNRLVRLLGDLGLFRVLKGGHLQDALLGVLVGWRQTEGKMQVAIGFAEAYQRLYGR